MSGRRVKLYTTHPFESDAKTVSGTLLDFTTNGNRTQGIVELDSDHSIVLHDVQGIRFIDSVGKLEQING